jgi:diguanylate cyclase (GGDEF)-like protein
VTDSEIVTSITGGDLPGILLAEDDAVTRMLLTRFLTSAGYRVDAVADGREALDKIIQSYYPILVSDWEMPEMDGPALCRSIRNMQLDGYVYMLLLTARDSKEHLIAGLESGADDYLIKPVHEPELIARLNTGRRVLALEHRLREANRQNRMLSITDALTGAFNRRYLMEQLPNEVERSRRYGSPLSVVMCDIDYFKRINDTCGHAAGDNVLHQFVNRVCGSIRSSSDWVARYGGEEFIIVLPETPHRGATLVAEKIRALIAATPFRTPTGETEVTASFGVASSGPTGPDLSLTVETLIGAADTCLYRSKQSGRNRTTSCELAPLTVDRAALGAELSLGTMI